MSENDERTALSSTLDPELVRVEVDPDTQDTSRVSHSTYIPEASTGAHVPEVSRSTYAYRRNTIEDIKENCRRRRIRYYEDREFPARDGSVFFSTIDDRGRPRPRDIVWKRPYEIARGNPKFIVGTKSRLDLHQGGIGNCWYIAGAATVATRPELFNRVIPPNQTFDSNYYGVFQFYFWRFGQWVEVIIDDRLPTQNGRLMFCKNIDEPNEFWGPLLEKAYAKLHGSYEALEGGWTEDALVDFTGGVGKRIGMRNKRRIPPRLFVSLQRDYKHDALLACCRYGPMEEQLPNGIVTGHAYSITMVTSIRDYRGKRVRLVRCRNPWGQVEWNRKWSDRSEAWNTVDERHRKELRSTDSDGEFWMSFEDWAEIFNEVQICHLPPDIRRMDNKTWCTKSYHGEWMRHKNAGGSYNTFYEGTFWRNPKYAVTLKDPDADDDDDRCTLVISLMQKYSRSMRTEMRTDNTQVLIDVNVFKVPTASPGHIEGATYTRRNLRKLRIGGDHQWNREVTHEVRLKPGTYVIIPSTQRANQSREFLLRLYTEAECENAEIQIDSTGDQFCSRQVCFLAIGMIVAILVLIAIFLPVMFIA